jgi:hypothetical protein
VISYSVSSRRSYSRAKGPVLLSLVPGCFLWHSPYLERTQGVQDGVRRGPAGLPGPLELAALMERPPSLVRSIVPLAAQSSMSSVNGSSTGGERGQTCRYHVHATPERPRHHHR